jgi:hypothetical protein
MSDKQHRKEILEEDQFAYYNDWDAEPQLSRWDIVRIFLFVIILLMIFSLGGQFLQNLLNYLKAN